MTSSTECVPTALSFSLYKELPTDALIATMASLLSEMCLRNDKCPSAPELTMRRTRFHCISAPNISLTEYLTRARRYSYCSDACFVAAIIYMDNVQRRSNLIVDSLSVHRLFITSLLLAAKFLEDRCQANSVYAQIGGLLPTEMNQLEVELLNVLQFSLDIEPEKFKLYESALLMRHVNLSAALATATATSTAAAPFAATPSTSTSSMASESTVYSTGSPSVSAISASPTPYSPVCSESSHAMDCDSGCESDFAPFSPQRPMRSSHYKSVEASSLKPSVEAVAFTSVFV